MLVNGCLRGIRIQVITHCMDDFIIFEFVATPMTELGPLEPKYLTNVVDIMQEYKQTFSDECTVTMYNRASIYSIGQEKVRDKSK